MAVSTSTALLGSAAIGAAGSVAAASMQEGAGDISVPSGPAFLESTLIPGVDVQRTQEGFNTRMRPGPRESFEQRRQMIDDLFGSIGVTDEERQQAFQQARDAFMADFEAMVEPRFQQQRQQLEAQQQRRGRFLSSVGRRERENLRRDQRNVFRREADRATLRARDIVNQDVNRRLNVGRVLRNVQQQDIGNILSQAQLLQSQAGQQGRMAGQRFGAELQQVQMENQQLANALQTGGALGGFAFGQLAPAQGPGSTVNVNIPSATRTNNRLDQIINQPIEIGTQFGRN